VPLGCSLFYKAVPPVILYGDEVCLTGGRELHVFKNSVPSNICGPREHEVRSLGFYVTRLRWAGHVAMMGDSECLRNFGGVTSWKTVAW